MIEGHARLVQPHDFARADGGADRAGARGGGGAGGVKEPAARPAAGPIQTPGTLGGGLAAARLGPVQRRGDAGEGGGVPDREGDFATGRAPLARAAPGDGGRKACEMIGRLPEAGFGPGGGAGARGGGQTIATGRSRAAKGRARAGGPAQTGADIIETEGGA